MGAGGEPHKEKSLLVAFGVEGWGREALGVVDGVVRSLLPLGAPASGPAEDSLEFPAEDGDDARVSTSPPDGRSGGGRPRRTGRGLA